MKWIGYQAAMRLQRSGATGAVLSLTLAAWVVGPGLVAGQAPQPALPPSSGGDAPAPASPPATQAAVPGAPDQAPGSPASAPGNQTTAPSPAEPAPAPADASAQAPAAGNEAAPAAAGEGVTQPPAPVQGAEPTAGTDQDGWSEASRTNPVLIEARERVRKGEGLFEAKNYDAALVEFERAYELIAHLPQRYLVLFNLGLCNEHMFRYTRAVDHYREFLKLAPADDPARPQVEATLRLLDGLLATLRVESNVEAEVWVDDLKVGTAPGDVLIAGGRHTVEIRAAGHEAVLREMKLPSRSKQTWQVQLLPLRPSTGLHPAYFWTGVGLTVVALGAGTGLGLSAQSSSDDAKALARRSDGQQFLNDAQTKRDLSAQDLRADIAFGVAGAFALGSAILFFLTNWDDEQATGSSGELRARIAPAVGPAGGQLHLQGQF